MSHLLLILVVSVSCESVTLANFAQNMHFYHTSSLPDKPCIIPFCLPEMILLSLQKDGCIGRGTFGTVNKAKWRGLVVAVKRMNTENEKKEFKSEIDILSRIKHENIVKLYGYSPDHSTLIMEFAEGGNLYDVLHSIPTVIYTIGHALSWSYQTAKGVSYLHQLRPKPLVHRDIKPPNLLLQDYCRKIKICDFGTACDAKTHMTSNQGSIMWMAPEVFASNKYTEKCDVFSWAITFWEILARKKPIPDPNMSPYAIMWNVISHGSRPPLLKNCPKFIEDLIVKCWDTDPEVRPSMIEVERLMAKIVGVFVTQELNKILLPENRIDRTVEGDYPDDESYPADGYGSTSYTQTEPTRYPFPYLYPTPRVIPFTHGTEPPGRREEVVSGHRRPSRDDRVPMDFNHQSRVDSKRFSSSSSQLSAHSFRRPDTLLPSNNAAWHGYNSDRYPGGNILASGYQIDQSMKPIQPDKNVPDSLECYRKHCQELVEYVTLDLELKSLQHRQNELMKAQQDRKIPMYDDEYMDNTTDIRQLEELQMNLRLQVDRLKQKHAARTAEEEGGWVYL